MVKYLQSLEGFDFKDLLDITRYEDGTWKYCPKIGQIAVKSRLNLGSYFLGLEVWRSNCCKIPGIPEAKGYGGFPVSVMVGL